jgi:hypothetical protein
VTEAEERLPVRRYGDSEVARILKRATELQRAEPSAADPEGLTLAELAEIAREAGIDPNLLRRAAAEVESRQPTNTWAEKLAGAPTRISIERTVPGELAPDRFDAIIPLIQRATEGQGTASAVGKTLTWSSRTENNTAAQQVLVASRDGETLIRVEERFNGLAGGLFGGIVGGVGIGAGVGAGGALAGILGSAFLGITLPLTVIGGSYAGARAIYTRIVRRREAAAVRLVDEIATYAAGETARALGAASSPS